MAFTHPPKREANVLGTLYSWPPLFYVRHAAATLMRIGSRERAMPRRAPLIQRGNNSPWIAFFALFRCWGRAGIRSCADGPLWRCSRTTSLGASTHPKTLRVPSGQRATVLGPRATPPGGAETAPPSRRTATLAGSTKLKVGNFVRLEERDPALRSPLVPRLTLRKPKMRSLVGPFFIFSKGFSGAIRLHETGVSAEICL